MLFQHIETGRVRFDDLTNHELQAIEEKAMDLYDPPAKVYVQEKHLKKPWFYLVYTKDILEYCKHYYIFKTVDSIAES